MKVTYMQTTECSTCHGVGRVFICLSCEAEYDEDTGKCTDYACYDDVAEEECPTCEGLGTMYLQEHIDNQY